MDSRYADAQLFCNCNLALIESLGKTNIKSYKSEDDVDKHMPQKGFGAGMYEEEDDALHESGEYEVLRFARAQNATAAELSNKRLSFSHFPLLGIPLDSGLGGHSS
jgi:hypothetical protein